MGRCCIFIENDSGKETSLFGGRFCWYVEGEEEDDCEAAFAAPLAALLSSSSFLRASAPGEVHDHKA